LPKQIFEKKTIFCKKGVDLWESDGIYMYSGHGKFMPLSPKTTQIQIIISQVKEEQEKRCFRHLMRPVHGFFMIKYKLFKIYS
jgi:hypothetical protein